MKLLVIEDSTDVRILIQLELTAHGYSVLAAGSAEAGLELARSERPWLVISDLGLPGMNGFDLMREIRADAALCHMPSIALSGFGESSAVARALAAGYDAAIVKPFESRDLLALIARLAPLSPPRTEMAP